MKGNDRTLLVSFKFGIKNGRDKKACKWGSVNRGYIVLDFYIAAVVFRGCQEAGKHYFEPISRLPRLPRQVEISLPQRRDIPVNNRSLICLTSNTQVCANGKTILAN